MKFRLIDDWRDAHRFGSVRASAVMASVFGFGPSLLSAWGALPDDLKEALPHGWSRVIAVAGFLLVLGTRVLTTDRGSDADQH
ncbi:hypothetical protein G3O06_20625 [Burkholderia sp. Ac-20345]|uniref:DUF7940 domain-containing protein n=1 Tax=Burkholderia sp. Ac-20345 TaxID=2703891 RepID=UPI00197B2768|nr:hypothetical protein [Burkholderia sp. Ac-20345]MBN3779945.1 hypothetical protein [Burkholderia sp. Ac-20345]